MKEFKIRSYTYRCNCGYIMNVVVDFGVPQESVNCRICKNTVMRESA